MTMGGDDSLLNSLEEAVQSHPEDPLHNFNLGFFLWSKGEGVWREKAAQQFMVAAKLNPQNWEAFRYLGDYYGDLDTNRSLKCYQRAVSLHPEDSHSGETLCNMLDKEGKESLELAVCWEASAKSPRAFWALRRLGYLLVHQCKWSDAVQSLQNAIRGYPTCADLWEALGLAYQRLGMYTAAIKSYGRALDLEDSRAFARIESGNIFLMLGSYRKGIESFRKALIVYPQNVSALYGLASALLALSKECIDTGAFVWATSLLEEAAECIKSTTKLAANLSCIWKLHGDIQFTLAKYLPWTGSEEINLNNNEKSLAASILAWKKTRSLAAVHSKCSFQRALHLAPWQANIYTDIAISMDLSFSLDECCKLDSSSRQLLEKMTLGSLLLEGNNYDFWVLLGCLTEDRALKQHGFIRGLQLDVSLAVAWAYLGKLYREEGDQQLARQAFDRARSIDPSLSLPWAGMSVDVQARDPASDEAYESCLRAVQTTHLAEFQIGLAQLALLFEQMLSPQVFVAIRQAVQQAPYYPETHNLNGLILEARDDYEAAIASYRLTRLALAAYNSPSSRSHINKVTNNLARVLCKAGYIHDAIQELELLKKEGVLDIDVLQLHAMSLWQAGKNDLALSAVRDLAFRISSIGLSSSFESISLICRLLYSISGKGSAINSISKMPEEFFHSAKVSFIVSSIHALDQGNHLESVVSCSRNFLLSQEVMEMHLLVALTKMIKLGPNLELQNGLRHLKKVLHMFPNCNLIRNSLGYILLSDGLGENSHLASRCYSILPDCSREGGFRTSHEILGAEAVACHPSVNCNFIYTSSTCKNSGMQRAKTFQQMQRWLHREPWNENAKYFFTLSLLQKARDERYPHHILTMLKQMTSAAIASEIYKKKNINSQYQKFQLLLSASETFLQDGNITTSLSIAKDASNLPLPNKYLFFAHLHLGRIYSAEGDHISLKEQIFRCSNLATDYPIGWICLKFIESHYDLQFDEKMLADGLNESLKSNAKSSNMWMALYKLASGLASYHAQDYLKAESSLAEACLWAGSESGLYLCHGAINMELAKQVGKTQYLTSALKSLQKAMEISSSPLPFASLLLAQAEASLGSKAKWERNLQLQWLAWPSDNKPAELCFQMHLLAKQTTDQSSYCGYGSPEKWVLRAIHLNPSCSRYWRTLCKLIE